MMTDKQFSDAFTAAGGWFFVMQFEVIRNWTGTKEELAAHVFSLGFDNKIARSKSRVSAALRILENGREEEALIKVRDSARIAAQHPQAKTMAEQLLAMIRKKAQDAVCTKEEIPARAAYVPGMVSGKIRIRRMACTRRSRP